MKSASSIVKNWAIVIAMIIVYLIFAVLSSNFRTGENAILILRQVSIIAVMGCGMSFAIIGGNFDLSVGSMLSLCCVMGIDLTNKIGPVPAIIIVIITGIVCGVLNGLLVGYLGLNSMIVTLGMMNVLQAAALMYTGGANVVLKDPNGWFGQIGKGSLGIIPYVTIITVIFLVVYALLLSKSVFGHQVLAVGTNPETCRFSGINDKKVVLMTFILSGFATAVAAIMLCTRSGSSQPNIGMGYEFDVITGVILGGASLSGGSGNIFKTFVGVMIIGIMKNGFIILGLPYYVQWLSQCIIILVAVWLAIQTEKKREVA